MILLDTNTCIYLMKNTFPSMAQKLFSHDPSDIAISAVTLYELEYGAAKSRWSEKTRNNLQLFLAPFQILSFTSKDAVVSGQLRALLESAGTPIGPYDLMIAAQGLAGHHTVITHNTKEFSRVPGLVLDDWAE